MILPYLYSYLLVVSELVCAMLFFRIFLQLKTQFKKWQPAIVAITALLFLITSWFMQFLPANSLLSMLLRTGIFTLQFYIFLTLLYNGPVLGKAALSLAIYWIIYGFGTVVVYGIGWVNALIGYTMQNTATERIVYGIVEKLLLFLVLALLSSAKRFYDKDVSLLRSPKLLIALCVPLVSLVSVFLLNQYTYKYSLDSPALVFTCFAWMLVGLMTYFLLQWLEEKERKLEESRLLEEQYRAEMKSAEAALRSSKKQQQMAHDFNNHMLCVRKLASSGQNADILAYLDGLVKLEEGMAAPIDTGNTYVDSILNYKLLDAAAKGVSIVYSLSELSCIPVAKNDVVAILANLLDNAIEACEKLATGRIIHFRMTYAEGELFISTRNPTAAPVHIINNAIATTKTDTVRPHGLGIASIQSTLDKYNALYSMEYKDNYFVFSCLINE